jgi:hypothetical protein
VRIEREGQSPLEGKDQILEEGTLPCCSLELNFECDRDVWLDPSLASASIRVNEGRTSSDVPLPECTKKKVGVGARGGIFF